MKNSLLFTAVISLMGCDSGLSGWTFLFDGNNVDNLRGYKQEDFPWGGWAIENGNLKTIVGGDLVDLVSKDVYKNFELELDWRVSPAGNSGIFYFATERTNYIWETAPEMQILDDNTHLDGKNLNTSAGSLFGLIAPSKRVVKPVGEFNHALIKVKNNRVEHWLNSIKILEYEYGSEELDKLIAKSKFKSMPHFAQADSGHIGLQHHGQEVWYRNIKIRKL